MASNARIGKSVLIVAVFALLYYICWVLIWPFMLIDDGNLIHSLFAPLEYAFLIPAVIGVLFIGGISAYTLYQLRNHIPTA